MAFRMVSSRRAMATMMTIFGLPAASILSRTARSTGLCRLTLNMLLSFAQFEREVTGERIRDKVAASKRKGMWMGGTVPLGYAVQDRKLVIDPAEAARVQRIYQAYRDHGTVRSALQHLAAEGITGKAGKAFSRGAMYHLLQNRLYRGEIVHRGQIHAGEHQAIIDADLWEATQRQLTQARADRRSGANASHPSLLAGLVTDPAGEAMVPTHASKGVRRYRYYVSTCLLTGPRAEHPAALRVPAAALERVVIDGIARLLADGPGLLRSLHAAAVLPADGAQQRSLLAAAQTWARRWPQQGNLVQRQTLLALGARIAVQRHEVTIGIAPQGLRAVLAGTATPDAASADIDPVGSLPRMTIREPVALRRAGREMALLVGSTVAADPSLVRLVAKAWALREALVSTRATSLTAFAAEQGMSQSYATRLIRLAWLAPDIVAAILGGCQPANLTATRLMRDTRIPTGWQEQRQALGFV